MGANLGGQIDKALFPRDYGREEEKMSANYARSQGASPGGARQGLRDMNVYGRAQQMEYQRNLYGQMFSQLAMLAAFRKFQQNRQAQMQQIDQGPFMPMQNTPQQPAGPEMPGSGGLPRNQEVYR